MAMSQEWIQRLTNLQDFSNHLQNLYSAYPDCRIIPLPNQGGCSYTVIVHFGLHEPRVLQFRLLRHALSWTLAQDAKKIYGDWAPTPLRFDVLACENRRKVQTCEMSVLEGVRVCDVRGWREGGEVLGERDVVRLEGLLRDLARFMALGWRAADQKEEEELKSCTSRPTGKVGASILDRLRKLERDLPAPRLRRIARESRVAFEQGGLESLPIALTHGDFIPSNIMVDEETLVLKGLVDWAEAECLPFGMSLYGIEHLLGLLHGHKFVYFRQADGLRDWFWACLTEEIRELRKESVWQSLQLARVVGILLWHGIAWDEGRIDRVVVREHDGGEIAYLEAFLDTDCVSSKL